ncbi:DUF6314 family protein [Arthrobacter sp. D1-17]
MNLQPYPGLRAYLLGAAPPDAPTVARWLVERTLFDRSAGTRGTFTGVAVFSANGDRGLRFREEGTVRWPAEGGEIFTGPATREYLLVPTGSPDALDMTFPDGRPFHRMSFTPEASQDRHWCDPDTYRVTYTLLGPGEFSYVWDVTGPRKNLLLESLLRRQPGPPGGS